MRERPIVEIFEGTDRHAVEDAIVAAAKERSSRPYKDVSYTPEAAGYQVFTAPDGLIVYSILVRWV